MRVPANLEFGRGRVTRLRTRCGSAVNYSCGKLPATNRRNRADRRIQSVGTRNGLTVGRTDGMGLHAGRADSGKGVGRG